MDANDNIVSYTLNFMLYFYFGQHFKYIVYIALQMKRVFYFFFAYIATSIYSSCSCYANAVLQCLTFTRPITSYLLQRLHSKTCKYHFMIYSGCLVVLVFIPLFIVLTFFTMIQVGSGIYALYASLNV